MVPAAADASVPSATGWRMNRWAAPIAPDRARHARIGQKLLNVPSAGCALIASRDLKRWNDWSAVGGVRSASRQTTGPSVEGVRKGPTGSTDLAVRTGLTASTERSAPFGSAPVNVRSEAAGVPARRKGLALRPAEMMTRGLDHSALGEAWAGDPEEALAGRPADRLAGEGVKPSPVNNTEMKKGPAAGAAGPFTAYSAAWRYSTFRCCAR